MSDPTPPVAPPTPEAPAAPPLPKPPKSGFGLGLTALLIGAFLVLMYLIVRTLSASLSVSYQDSFEPIAIVFGVLGIVAVLPIAVVIVLGHLGAARSRGSHKGGVVSGIALGIGYFLLLMWGNRLISAAIAAFGYDDPGYFLNNVFWWV